MAPIIIPMPMAGSRIDPEAIEATPWWMLLLTMWGLLLLIYGGILLVGWLLDAGLQDWGSLGTWWGTGPAPILVACGGMITALIVFKALYDWRAPAVAYAALMLLEAWIIPPFVEWCLESVFSVDTMWGGKFDHPAHWGWSGGTMRACILLTAIWALVWGIRVGPWAIHALRARRARHEHPFGR